MLNYNHETPMPRRVRTSEVFEPLLLMTKWNWYLCKRRHSRWKRSL